MATALVGVLGCVHAAQVAYIGAAIGGGIGIENFFVMAGAGDADIVAVANDRSSVENGDDDVVGILAAADERVDAIVGVVGVNPLEALPLKIDFVESGFVSYELIEIGYEALDAPMRIVLSKCQSRLFASVHSCRWANSCPMKRSFLPGCAYW